MQTKDDKYHNSPYRAVNFRKDEDGNMVCPNGKKQIKGQCRSFRYVSLNPSIASVSANGKVKGLTPGNCIVRVYAKNGCSRDVKVVVK